MAAIRVVVLSTGPLLLLLLRGLLLLLLLVMVPFSHPTKHFVSRRTQVGGWDRGRLACAHTRHRQHMCTGSSCLRSARLKGQYLGYRCFSVGCASTGF
jgi:hypothetical protein